MPHAPPLVCEDLVRDDVFTLSHSGSHHYLALDKRIFGLGELTFVNVNPLFDNIGKLSVTPAAGGSAVLSSDSYAWRPDFVSQSGNGRAGESVVTAKQATFYSDQETINCNISLHFAGGAASGNLTVAFDGSLHLSSAIKQSSVTAVGGAGVLTEVDFVPDNWDNNGHIEKMFALFTIKGVTYIPVGNHSTTGVGETPALTITLQTELALSNQSASQPPVLTPARSAAATEASINGWLAAVNTPTDPSLLVCEGMHGGNTCSSRMVVAVLCCVLKHG
jgi:hypothetical protein